MKTIHKLALVAALSLASCAAMQDILLTPEQQSRIEAIDREALELEAELKQKDLEAKAAADAAAEAQAAEDAAAMQEQKEILEALAADILELKASIADLDAEEAEIVDSATANAQTLAGQVLDATVPDGPWKLPLLGAAALASRGLTRRGRRHLKKGAKAAGNLAVADAVKSFLAAAGYHSGTAEDAAESFKDAAQREAIQAKSTDSATEDLVRAAVRDAMTAIAEKANDKEQG